MSYLEHVGYVHMEKLLERPSKKFATGYYQLLGHEDREQLRSCLARFHNELNARKRRFDELKQIADKLETLMGAANLVRDLSSDSEVESPRDKRAKAREETKTAEPTSTSSWTLFGRAPVPTLAPAPAPAPSSKV